MGNRRAVARAPHRPARQLTGVYAVATVVALVLTAVDRHRRVPGRLEELFGLLNIPVAPTFVSVVILALVTRALLGRKRIGLWLVGLFQVFGIYIGVAWHLRSARLPLTELWETRGDLGAGLDTASILVALAVIWWLWRLRSEFTARLQPGSWWVTPAALLVGSAVTVGVAWLLLGLAGAPRSQARDVALAVLAVVSGVGRRALPQIPWWVTDAVAVCAAVTILGAVMLFLASSRPPSRWSPEREVALRRLLAQHGDGDSLGYFATRRDKASVFSPDGLAAVTYRVISGVSLASADPIGHRDSWQPAIEAWRAEAREFGWVPAVIGTSEAGARAFAVSGMRVLALGDEAILEPARFDLRRASLAPVRHAVRRAAHTGLVVHVRRQRELDVERLREIDERAEAWRAGEPERGFSMALGRPGDVADGDILHVTAERPDGELVGVLSFVPWGRSGISLDVMRRSPTAPNGVTELMVGELMARAVTMGLTKVSLNFCMFRAVFEDAERLGSRPVRRFNASVLGLFDRFWQLERLYRSNKKYEPTWQPRFLCYDDAVSLPQVAVAAGAAEGFLPWPSPRRPSGGRLDDGHLAEIAELEAEPVHVPSLGRPRRSDQSRERLATVERMRAAGHDAYPVASSGSTTSLADLRLDHHLDRQADEGAPSVPVPVSVVGRVRELRDHGSVVFVTLVDGGASVQVVLEAGAMGECLTSFTHFVDVGDLVRIEAVTGRSRRGTPSLMARSWRMEAKSLHPIPFRSFGDPEARVRQRSTDLVVHPDEVALLRRRSAVVASVRRTLCDEGFCEVETPMLQTTHGGASARPFRTFINAYGLDLSLRIAPELYLKRLIVGGVGPIFELGRSFRNEGADATHNPEFTSLEAYQPHADYTTMRHLTERIIKDAARRIHGREVMPLPSPDQVRTGTQGVALVDVGAAWPVVPVLHAVSDAVGRPVTLDTDMDVLLGIARERHVAVRTDMRAGAVIEELYSELVEPATLHPTFYTDFPSETSPLTRPHRSQPGLAERWDLVIAGMEIGTAYSELTDPLDQRARLTEQSIKAAAGNPEAMAVDEDFLSALELGMPPSGGLGLGIDRLVMVLTNTPIRAVLTFPFVRPTS